MAKRSPQHSQKYRLTERQPFFLWLVLFGLLLQVDHLRRISSSENDAASSVTPSSALRKAEQEATAAAAAATPRTSIIRNQPKAPFLNRYKVPNVLLVGVQKAATNSVASWIYRHLNVCQPVSLPEGNLINGAHFFNTDDRYFKVGIDDYGKHFSHCGKEKNHTILMDATPDYFMHPNRVRETYDLLDGPYASDLKLIMIMREPVEREFSWYNALAAAAEEEGCPQHVLKRVRNPDGSPRNFQSYLDNVILPDIDTDLGQYGMWFGEWLKHFPRKQILLLSFDELNSNPKSVMKRLRNYLGLKPDPNEDLTDIVDITTKGANEGQKKQRPLVPCPTQKSFGSNFEKSNQKFYDLANVQKGPPQEQSPFPKFQLAKCKDWNNNNQGNNNKNNKGGDKQGQQKKKN